MWNRRTHTSMALIMVLVLMGSLVQGSETEILPVNSPADLDLSGDIMYAVNFGDNGNPTVGGTVFSQDEECPGITLEAVDLFEGPATWWGPYPGTEDAGLNLLLNGMAATSIPSDEFKIDVQGLVSGRLYLLQLVFYEPENHGRSVDFTVENEKIVTGFDPLNAQGGVAGQGGSLIKYEFTAGDSILNILMVNYSHACGLSGLILTEIANPVAFTDYGSGTTIELAVGKGIWKINWGQGPWTWSNSTDAPLLDANVSGILDLHTTAPADISDDLLATLPIAGKLTLSAHDAINKDVVIGTMVLSGTGINVIDINASRLIMDEGSGMCLAPFPAPAPKLTLAMEEATGVFAHVEQTADWELSFAGSYAAPLMEGVELQDNIFAALGGKVPIIGGIGTFALSGEYVPDETKRAQSFCQYGTGVSERLGAGGALWNQAWTGGPRNWHECPASVNMPFLGENVSGTLETTTAGAPSIDENMVLSFSFGGQMRLTDYNEVNPDQIDGQIIGDAEGMFVADINAENATFDADGNILIAFGASVHDARDCLITVTETTGTFSDIQQAGAWAWYVDGTMTIARVETLPLQQNILAALQQPELLLGAQEEFVLTGLYLRNPSQE
ncbi:MAG: hypothetical protein HQ515_24655 [Phycisphaeraceae bacterium]|nr:hypothetical protein [Phycisphaeraceae bacterium]